MTRLLAGCGMWVLGLAMVSGGCREQGPEMFPVRGTVTLDGQPLAEGTVYFKTAQTGDIDTLPVKDGKFAGKALAGERRVEVVAYRMIPISGPMGGEVQEPLIAAKFNSASTLTAEVLPRGANEFKFAVESPVAGK